MKTKIILAGFLGIIGIANAQPWNYSFANQDISCVGSNGGVQITNSSGNAGHAGLFLDNQMAGGHRYSFSSIGVWSGLTVGDLSLYDWTSQAEIMHVLGSNANIGIGTPNPTEQLHTTSGVRFQGLTTNLAPNNFVTLDGTGKLFKTVAFPPGITNACTSTNFVPKSTSAGNLLCSQIYDNGTYVGVNNSANSPGFTYVAGSWLLQGNPMVSGVTTGNFRFMVGGYTESAGFYASSDERFKKDIRSINNALSIINKLDGKTYSWRTEEFKDRGFNNGLQVGFIAQELEKVIPEVVVTKSDGYKSVNYDMIVPILAQGIKERQAQIDEQIKLNNGLASQIADLQKQMTSVSDNNTDFSAGIDQLGTIDSFELGQNIPDPVSNETMIKYSLPEGKKDASLLVYDLSGKQLAALVLDRDASFIAITSDTLSPGIYIYSVMADGEIFDSKKMIVAGK